MIVPVSLVSTDGFNSLRKFMVEKCSNLFLSNYAMRPGKLFDGVDKHLTIFISSIGSSNNLFSSKYQRWLSECREALFSNIQYVAINKSVFHNDSIPKISTELQLSILLKIKKNKEIAHYLIGTGQYNGFHTRKLRYFVQFLDCAPKIFEEDGRMRVTSELKRLKFNSKEEKHIGIATFLSTLFFWYYIDYSDCRNVNKREVHSFPFNLSNLSNADKSELYNLGVLLLNNLQDNSYFQIASYVKYGTLKMQTFRPRKSKFIIDQIDTILAQHYGFTEEELDFIINYDIKYRMGKALFGEESNEEDDE